MLMFANKYFIKWIDLRGMDTDILVNNLTNAVAVDYDYSDNCYYWSDITNQGSTIKRKCKAESVEVLLFFIKINAQFKLFFFYLFSDCMVQ